MTNSYYSLAQLMPSELGLVNCGSTGWQLLVMASERLAGTGQIAMDDFLPTGGVFPAISGTNLKLIKDLLDSNGDTQTLTRLAIECGDFSIPTVSYYGALSREPYRLPLVCEMRDLLALKSRILIKENKFALAIASLDNLCKFCRMIGSSGAELGWYGAAVSGMSYVTYLVTEMLCFDLDSTHLSTLSDVLGSGAQRIDAYAAAAASEFFCDILIALRDIANQVQLSPNVEQVFENPLFGRLYRISKGDFNIESKPVGDLEFSTKVQAIASVLQQSTSVLISHAVVEWMSESYICWKEKFRNDLRARMVVPKAAEPRVALWPEHFQLTSRRRADDVLINQAAPTPVAATNALGLLILRDVLEAANAIIDRLIIVPWRDAINIEFVQVLLAVRQSQKKYGTTPAETAQLVEDGLLPMIPTDRLTGEPIRILPEKNQIAGPELELIRTLMAYPLDAPEVRWRIPEIGQCLEK